MTGLLTSRWNDRDTTAPPIRWPDGRSFAFTIFDDPDAQTVEQGKRVYGFLADLGFRTTRGVWPSPPTRTPNSQGDTCGDREYLRHTLSLQTSGFEVGYHNTTKHSSYRGETGIGLDRFRSIFGGDPSAMANHYNAEAIYWGPARITPPLRAVYTVATAGRTSGRHFGDVEGHPFFWGDMCLARIRYCRNFVYRDVNTLAACPWMPYVDPLRKFVSAWFASSEGSNVRRFVSTLAEANQDTLEADGGACVMYAHFGHGFISRGALNTRFRELMIRLVQKNGWFVPVSTLLDYIRAQRGLTVLDRPMRRRLESRWLSQKLFRGTS
jgi:hypothetical protein